jgi:lysyl-tRNA synthetase class I
MAGAYNSSNSSALAPGDAIAGLDDKFNAVERQLENVATDKQRFSSPEEVRSKIELLKREETELLKQQVTLMKQKNLCLVQQQQHVTVAGGSMCCLCFERYR